MVLSSSSSCAQSGLGWLGLGGVKGGVASVGAVVLSSKVGTPEGTSVVSVMDNCGMRVGVASGGLSEGLVVGRTS